MYISKMEINGKLHSRLTSGYLNQRQCYITYLRHTLSHFVTNHVTSYFVYYFVQVLFRSLPPFRTMSPFIFVSLPCLPVALFVFRSVSSHCCLPWLHLSFLHALGTWLHFYRSSAFL